MNYEEYQYHPRYGRSEYHTLCDEERRQRRIAYAGLLLAGLCLFGIVYLLG